LIVSTIICYFDKDTSIENIDFGSIVDLSCNL